MSPWRADWAWGVPLILVTIMFHVYGLGVIKRNVDRRMQSVWKHQVFSIGAVTLSITVLHVVEAGVWAATFTLLGAVPDRQTAALYSLNALTAFGHTDVTLERHWQLMGAMESLNGWILFGLSSAYLFVLIQSIWSHDALASRTKLRL